MANALASLKVNLPAASLDQLDEVAKGSSFLPRVQLITKGKYVDTGKIAPGHWGVPQPGGTEIEDLGESIDIIPFAFRPKAMDVKDRDAIVTVFDAGDPEFKRIVSAPKNTGCIWGPTFLIYERNTNKFYELFFGNASGRAEAGKMRPFLPGPENDGLPSPATIGIRYKQTKDYGWHVPVITKCTMEFDTLPEGEAILETIEKFNVTPSGIEKVVEDEKVSKRAR